MNELFNYVSGFGECTPLKNIKTFIGLCNGETYGLDTNGEYHNGYAVLDNDNKKQFLARFTVHADEINMNEIEIQISGEQLNVCPVTGRNY